MEHSIPERYDVNDPVERESGEPKEIGGLVSGKKVLLVSLAALSLVPLITWATLRKVEADLAIDQPPLSWAGRADWPSPPVKRVTLERPRSNYGALSESKWRDLDFAVSPQIESATAALHALAVAPEAFASQRTREQLEHAAAEQPDFFYPVYLLGTWHRVHGDAATANRYYQQAFALAPAVVELRYRDPGDAPAANVELGLAELTCDRVIDGKIDQTLKLAYPRLVTDQRGTVYLPAFHAVYRATILPRPRGYGTQYHVEGWFQFPGRIGSPKPAVIWKRPTLHK